MKKGQTDMKNKKELTTLAESAQERDVIDAEKKTAVSEPQPGEKIDLAAGGNRNKDAEFEALIDGEYKEQFSKKVQKILKGRLREVKAMKETADKNAQLVSTLMEKLNITDGDTEKLERKIESNMQQERTQELLRRLIAENNLLKRNREEDRRRVQMKNRAEEWRKQAKETKETYPDFDFEKELKNPEFVRLIRVGVSVKNAYEVTNLKTILEDISKNAEKMVVNTIRSKGTRPVENGSDASGGILLSSNVSKLNKKQRAELAKRAAKGEKIEF